MSKRALGKGLGALITELEDVPIEQTREVAIRKVTPQADQPRKHFDEERLAELASSIREHGVVQPILVRPLKDGYELVAGERRWRAAQLAGLERIPAVVMDLSEAEVLEIALIENIQREDLNPVEEARAYQKLIDTLSVTQEQLARRLGKSRSHLANAVRLLTLPDTVLQMLERGDLSMGHAKVLVGVSAEHIQPLAERVVAGQMSVRDLEKTAKTVGKRNVPRGTKAAKALAIEIKAVEEQMKQRLGTMVKVNGDGIRGKIEIDYYSTDDLNRILELIGTE